MEETIKHIGIIADGNRRWARERGLPTLEGHKKGLDAVESLIEAAGKKQIPYLSFYLFSTENWNRSEEEVSYLMKLLSDRIGSLAKKMQKNNIRLLVLGAREPVSPALLKKLDDAVALTKDCTGTTVGFCFNYGGKQEIADAVNEALAAGEKITPETIENHLYAPEIPACDLIVRTSGEQRLSGYMLWRSSYAELLFEPKYFPALDGSDLDRFIDEFKNRQRRFGK